MDIYRITLEQRIAALWSYRAWWRQHRWAEHTLRRHETDIELRALVRLARQARRAERIAAEHREREARRLAEEWTEAEKAAAWGYA